MKRIWYIFGLLMCLSAGVKAQVTVDAKIDRAQIKIGEQAAITLEVSAEKDAHVDFPHYPARPLAEEGEEGNETSGEMISWMVDGVEVVEELPIDTTWIDEGKRMSLKAGYTITSFDPNLYYLPPMKVTVGGEDYTTKQNLALKVVTVPIDTVEMDICDIKDVMEPAFDEEIWKERKGTMSWALLLLVLGVVLAVLIILLKDNKPILRRIRLKARIAPHKAAMQKIERIKSENAWQQADSEQVIPNEVTKEYYTLLTDTLREYIRERYGFNAMEMTSDEIIEKLQSQNDPTALSELRELFTTADLVKFAKYQTQITENDRYLLTAIEYINTTKQEDDALPQNQPEEVVVEAKGSKKTRLTLMVLVAVLGLGALVLLGYVMWKLYWVVV